MDEEFQVTCPYCGEEVELFLEADLEGTLVQDCSVCCQPWQVRISGSGEERSVELARSDGSD